MKFGKETMRRVALEIADAKVDIRYRYLISISDIAVNIVDLLDRSTDRPERSNNPQTASVTGSEYYEGDPS